MRIDFVSQPALAGLASKWVAALRALRGWGRGYLGGGGVGHAASSARKCLTWYHMIGITATIMMTTIAEAAP